MTKGECCHLLFMAVQQGFSEGEQKYQRKHCLETIWTQIGLMMI